MCVCAFKYAKIFVSSYKHIYNRAVFVEDIVSHYKCKSKKFKKSTRKAKTNILYSLKYSGIFFFTTIETVFPSSCSIN